MTETGVISDAKFLEDMVRRGHALMDGDDKTYAELTLRYGMDPESRTAFERGLDEMGLSGDSKYSRLPRKSSQEINAPKRNPMRRMETCGSGEWIPSTVGGYKMWLRQWAGDNTERREKIRGYSGMNKVELKGLYKSVRG